MCIYGTNAVSAVLTQEQLVPLLGIQSGACTRGRYKDGRQLKDFVRSTEMAYFPCLFVLFL
jgi:hypothetical protein